MLVCHEPYAVMYTSNLSATFAMEPLTSTNCRCKTVLLWNRPPKFQYSSFVVHHSPQHNLKRRKFFGLSVSLPPSTFLKCPYSGGPEFKSRSRNRLSWLRFSWFPSVPPGKYRDSTLNWAKTASFDILSNSSFIDHHIVWRYTSLHKPQINKKYVKMAVSWVVAPCSLVEVYRRFRDACCLHHQGDV
jgi:hypothetical protein